MALKWRKRLIIFIGRRLLRPACAASLQGLGEKPPYPRADHPGPRKTGAARGPRCARGFHRRIEHVGLRRRKPQIPPLGLKSSVGMTRLDCAVTRRACAAPEGARRTNPTPTQRFRAGLNSLSRIVERDPSGKGFLGLPPFDYAQGRLLSPKAGERMGHPTPLNLSLRAPALGARNLLFVIVPKQIPRFARDDNSNGYQVFDAHYGAK